jgi:4-aminobutyrate aminotransferase/4-aminobutyrate aminotransferase/(S)-3-amino-2-methylpropionate transaminase
MHDQFPRLVTAVPGPRSLALWERERQVIAPGLQSVTQWARVSFSHGEGAILFDVDGNAIIDFMAGIGVSSIGHGHPKHARAIAEQAAKITAGSFTSEPRVELLETLREVLPSHLTRVQLYSGGAEAVEAALRLARCATRKSTVVSFWGGYHGKTEGTRPLSEGEQTGYGLPSPGSHAVPYANPYHCPFGCDGNCTRACTDFLRQSVEHGSNREIAAIIVEPVQGRGGNIVPPPGFLREVQQAARDLNALLIVDEMITGFCRTGSFFGFMHEDGVEPDILIMGKGFGNGFPISGVAAREEVARAEPWAKPSGNSSSYGGNALACAAALATIGVLREERLDRHAAELGTFMLEELRRVTRDLPLVGEVRGKGLLLGIELVRYQAGRTPLAREEMRRLFTALLGEGLLVMPSGSALRINPPLVITHEQAASGIEILGRVLARAHEILKDTTNE